jgi:hypothetical protein
MTGLRTGSSLPKRSILPFRSVSPPWLSNDMAHALAAMCPPLDTSDVMQAADMLTARLGATHVIDRLLRLGVDLLEARQVVEALGALRDAPQPDSQLAGWLLVRESGVGVDGRSLAAAAERVCWKLSGPLSRLVSPAGSQGILSRALRRARAGFPFLDGVRAGTPPETCLGGLGESVGVVDTVEETRGLLAVLDTIFDLLIALIGRNLTLLLVRDVWPESPMPREAK